MSYFRYGHSRDDKIANCRDKREQLVVQCKRAGISATLCGKNKFGGRIKPTTINKMRQLLKAKGVNPCC